MFKHIGIYYSTSCRDLIKKHKDLQLALKYGHVIIHTAQMYYLFSVCVYAHGHCKAQPQSSAQGPIMPI